MSLGGQFLVSLDSRFDFNMAKLVRLKHKFEIWDVEPNFLAHWKMNPFGLLAISKYSRRELKQIERVALELRLPGDHPTHFS